MSWYVVTCRLCGDDEDTCHITQADDWQDATRKAEWALREASGEPLTSDEDEVDESDPDETRPAFYMNYVINCGDTEPHIEVSNP
jgi:hypothetical protein